MPPFLLNKCQGLVKASAAQEMLKPRWNPALEALMLELNCLKGPFEGFEVSLWIPVTETMISDDGSPFSQ